MFRPYDPELDRDAVLRIWREVGWVDDQEEVLDLFLSDGKTLLADIDGSAECMVVMIPGTIRYLEEELPLAIVGGVTTSLIARKQKFASRLTALSVANGAAEGALVSGLGMFEQGFYNRLGFGTASYIHHVAFDPADIAIDAPARAPRRITADDWEAVHASRVSRRKGHGAVCAGSPKITRGEMVGDKKAFGLGYFDGPNGELTHHLWINPEDMGKGPYVVKWHAWQTREQFRELMGLLRSFGDQVGLVSMDEPQGVLLQDILRQPFRKQTLTEDSKLESKNTACAYQQVRILDLPGCMSQTHLQCADLQFNLELTDPIEKLLDADAPWHGISGEYAVSLGSESSAARGAAPSLPTLTASVNAFSRMWFGVRPASGLAITDDIAGPPDLLRSLDAALRLPTPYMGWEI